MSKKSSTVQPVSGVSTLAVSGEVQVTETFFHHLDERIRESVGSAMADALDRLQNQLSTLAPSQQQSKAGGGLKLAQGEAERAKNARGGSLGLKLNEGQGMIDGKALAIFLDISYRALYRLMAEGAIPDSISLGGRMKRWSVEDILAWVMNGCPRAEHWKRRRVQAIRDYRELSSTKDHRRG
jgi:predicted DNA-binding transcriptional regulator AlpA